jgi:ribulose-5-phosphate 4-epimerase/fuculose-1-phosphate aldolase
MPSNEAALREEICRQGRSLFERALTPGSSGNLSARLDDGYLVTPTNACLGTLDPARLSKLDTAGQLVSGDPPTKEVPLHLALYEARPSAGGVAHIHSTWATALSSLADLDPADVLPALTPYIVMRVGRVALIRYVRPGSPDIREPVLAVAREHPALLLANHGPVVAAPTFLSAVYAAEEIEQAAKIFFVTRGLSTTRLSAAQIADLEANFHLR